MGSPRCSVVIPTYNRSAVLAYAIRSVLAQTMEEFELLVVGDGCDDDSEDLVSGCADSRVHWLNLPVNTGHQSGPNNAALRRAASPFVAYLGHDDLWLPGHLEAIMPALEKGAAFVHSSVAICSPGRSLRRLDKPPWWRIRGRRKPWIPPTCFAHPVAPAIRLGGWPGPDACGRVDPEAQLAWALTRGGGRRVHIPRLTAVKLPAAHRENCYLDANALEQAAWWALISHAQDSEASVAEAVRLNRPPVAPKANATKMPGPILSTPKRHQVRRRYKGLPPVSGAD
ncbi:glycosyltransferase family 2 protein [Elongatibacter sediminis]|uniref:Glycosyltransferase family 2 protein n=1 Tax=Elongatibacter sediminis TaxID=3119006 RepID=A0AAW9RKF5_9GAMM